MTEVLVDSTERQLAVDPNCSVLVQAPAGSGKTSLLVTRFLNLLEGVQQPEEILALTFTRKAAAEMRNRVLAALADPNNECGRRLQQRGAALAWNLDRQPSRLRIQTIDSFAAGVAAALPVAAGIGRSRIVTDATALYDDAVLRLFERIDRYDDIAPGLADFLALHDNDFGRARRALVDMLGRRDQWLDPVRAVLQIESDLPGALRQQIASGITAVYTDLIARLEQKLSPAERAEIAAVTQYSAAQMAVAIPDQARGAPLWQHAARVFLTNTGAVRKRFDVNIGFPPGRGIERTMKARAAALAPVIQTAVAPLNLLLHAPKIDTPAAEIDALLPIALTLGLAAVELEQGFASERSIDFTQLLLAAKRALGDNDRPTDLALALDHRVRHLLIDEFQDTSAAQMAFLRQLMSGWTPGDGHTFFAVGDPMQSIYLFRDADVALFQAAAREGIAGHPIASVALRTNFRASTALINWFNGIFPAVFGLLDDAAAGAMTYRPAAAPAGSDSGPINPARVVGLPRSTDRLEEARFVCAHVEGLRANRPQDSVAVLVRSRSHAAAIIAQLTARAVPWRGPDMNPLAEEAAVRDLIAVFRAAWDPDDRLAWYALLRSPLVGLGRRDLGVIADRLVAPSVVVADPSVDSHCTADGRQRLQRLRATWRKAMPDRLLLPPAQWLEGLWLRLGGADAYEDTDAIDQAARVFELIEAEQPYLGAPRELESALTRLYADPTTSADAVWVLTIHGAKGLEFDHVVLPGLDRGTPPDEPPLVQWRLHAGALLIGSATVRDRGSVYHWLQQRQSARTDNERARLLYVAATRARRSLLMTAEYEPGMPVDPRSLLRLLDEGVIQKQVDTAAPIHTSQTKPERAQRLRADYLWQPPSGLTTLLSAAPATLDSAQGPPVGEPGIAMGIVIHRELAHLAARSLPPDTDAFVVGRRAALSRSLAGLGVDGVQLDHAVDEIIAQLRRTLHDPVGRWILSSPGESELALRSREVDGVGHHVVDRVLTDESGTCWVIDYKTGQVPIGLSEDTFVASQLRDHTAQLRRYARLVEQIKQQRPRAAVYLTALARLVELGPVP